MKYKINWENNDFVNSDDYNRIMTAFSPASSGVYGEFTPVDASHVFTARDIQEMRHRYELTAQSAGVLSPSPSGAHSSWEYEEFDPDVWKESELFPRLVWLCTWKGDYNFPAAWELNLYERLCQYIEEHLKG